VATSPAKTDAHEGFERFDEKDELHGGGVSLRIGLEKKSNPNADNAKIEEQRPVKW